MWHKLADAIGTDENSVEDQLLADDRWDYIEKFFQVIFHPQTFKLQHSSQVFHNDFQSKGSKSLMFYYQEVARDAVPVMRVDAASTVAPGPAVKKLFITNGSQEPLLGLCMFFVRNTNEKEITNQNIANVIMLEF